MRRGVPRDSRYTRQAMTDRDDIDAKKMRSNLKERRDQLLERANSNKDSRDTVELDQARLGRLSRIDAMQGQAMAQETERRRKVELQRIEAALERLDTDEFGYCLTCGDKIALKRLELDPAVTLCITCADKAAD